MAQAGCITLVRSDKDNDFTGAILQNASETENLVPPMSVAAGGHCQSRLRSISIISIENLAWELWFFSKNTFNNNNPADIDLVYFLGKYTFAAADAVREAGAGAYFYFKDALDIPIRCEDFDNHSTVKAGAKVPAGQIHVMLINRSAAAKTAGANGAVVIQLGLEPVEGRI